MSPGAQGALRPVTRKSEQPSCQKPCEERTHEDQPLRLEGLLHRAQGWLVNSIKSADLEQALRLPLARLKVLPSRSLYTTRP